MFGKKKMKRIHIAAAAQQLNRKLFDATPFEGRVMAADQDNLVVIVNGEWDRAKISSFADYSVSWFERAAA